MATASLTRASDYRYAIPLNPDNIKGTVIGTDAIVPYVALRSEDIAFMYEAICEFVEIYWALTTGSSGSSVNNVDKVILSGAPFNSMAGRFPNSRVHIVNKYPNDGSNFGYSFTSISFPFGQTTYSQAWSGISVGIPTNKHIQDFFPHLTYESGLDGFYSNMRALDITVLKDIYSSILFYQSLIIKCNAVPPLSGICEYMTDSYTESWPDAGHWEGDNYVFNYTNIPSDPQTSQGTSGIIYHKQETKTKRRSVFITEDTQHGIRRYYSDIGYQYSVNEQTMDSWNDTEYVCYADHFPAGGITIGNMFAKGLLNTQYRGSETTASGSSISYPSVNQYKWIDIPITSYDINEVNQGKRFRITFDLDIDSLKSQISPNDLRNLSPEDPINEYTTETSTFESINVELMTVYLFIKPSYRTTFSHN